MDPSVNTKLCHAEQSVLVIIDIQTRLTAAMPAKILARIQRNLEALIKAATLLKIPVLVSEQYPRGLGPLEPDLEKLLPDYAVRYEKTTFSCMGAGNFAEDLARLGRGQVILTGMETHICVLQTAIELQRTGATVFVAADAVCSRQRDNYETGLQRLHGEGIIITVTESILFEWMRDARHELFKQIQALVR